MVEVKHKETGEKLLRVDLDTLSGADLRVVMLVGADLTDADLSGANLPGADLRDTDLRRANLWGANLLMARLENADMGGADLRDAQLLDRRCCYAHAILTAALYDAKTRWPSVFDRQRHGAVRIIATRKSLE
jgi:uncharacterized protein YjbI with pentapeptide repeats